MSLSLLDKLKESDNFSSHGMATHTDAPHCRVCERSYDGSQHFGIEVSHGKEWEDSIILQPNQKYCIY
ncbi:unnamed protein product [Heligmosomoides polygyrus]|uniref:Uncharacterized protein n=1 Tax=Heligmosomoides polygyrus TaxID=6339 RepID=A0A183GX05_HELPZ|nr:unnamed protein product [Heligmosomoides polygyrus]